MVTQVGWYITIALYKWYVQATVQSVGEVNQVL